MTNYLARTGNRGNGTTHLYPVAARNYRVNGVEHTGTAKALCGSVASSAAREEGEVTSLDGFDVPCAKCLNRADIAPADAVDTDDSETILANGTRVEFTRSHIDANGVTTRRVHTGVIVGSAPAHPDAPRPRRSYEVIVDGHEAGSWEATHPLTFLADDIAPVSAPVLAGYAVTVREDGGRTYKLPEGTSEDDAYEAAETAGFIVDEDSAPVCGYPGCEAVATDAVTLPLPEGRSKDVAVCDTHSQGARFLADTLSEWTTDTTTREAVDALFPAPAGTLADWETEFVEAVERRHEDTEPAPASAPARFVAWFNSAGKADLPEMQEIATADSDAVENVAAAYWMSETEASTDDYGDVTDAVSLGTVELGDDGVMRDRTGEDTEPAPASEDSTPVRPWVGWQRRTVGLAGQIGYTVSVQYPGEPVMTVSFVGSVYGKPGAVTMLTGAGLAERQTIVEYADRFGRSLDVNWIRRFYGYGDDSECGMTLADGSQHDMGRVTKCKREMIHAGNHSIYRV